mmetsp:Transcript_11318/g.15562  ORF Transcript_11318/g.15562 Transcript_11318/m.15562 type:complete len:84 (+) Transcript_11318:253-504(+)
MLHIVECSMIIFVDYIVLDFMIPLNEDGCSLDYIHLYICLKLLLEFCSSIIDIQFDFLSVRNLWSIICRKPSKLEAFPSPKHR